MSLSTNFPTVGPVLNLDFVNNQTLDPRITFTRASTATYYDAQTSAVAEQNLLLQSQTFDNASWSKTAASVTADSSTAPDGTSTADTLIPDTANTAHFLRSATISTSTNAQCTFSVYAKPSGYNFIRVQLTSATANPLAFFNVSTGVVGTIQNNSGTVVSTSITSVGGGWYRCVVSATPESGGAFVSAALLASNADNVSSFAGDGTSGVLIWGAQLEQRSTATAYTVTTTAPITNYIPVLLTAQNNIPRFDFNPVTRVPQGLLIEESRTNLLLRSDDFGTTWTTSNASISTNATVAPDGTLTADKFIADATNNAHWVNQTTTLSSSNYMFSFYAKAAEYGVVQALNSSSGTDFVNFDLVNGVVGSNSGYTGSIATVGNGWYRCIVSLGSTSGTAAWARLGIVPAANSARATAFTGNGFSGIFLWGAQLEAGAFPTSYIPTVAATVTRSTDVASMTGTNFSSWFNASEGTIYSEAELINGAAVVAAGTTNFTVTWISDGGGTNFITQRYNAAASPPLQFGGLVNSVAQWAFTSAGLPLGAYSKNASAYKFNDIAQSVNAGTVGTDTSATLPIVNRLDIGVGNVATQALNGHIRKLAYYNFRMTNAQLQALTRS